MALLFDSALTAALGRELDRAWVGQRLEAVFFDGESRRVRLVFRENAWGWFLHPLHGVLVRIPPPPMNRRRPDRGILVGRRLVERVEVEPDARRLNLKLTSESDEPGETLVFELVTNRWNAIYVVGRVRAVLHQRPGDPQFRPGAEWNPFISPRVWTDSLPDPAEWKTFLDSGTIPDSEVTRRIAYLSSINEAAVFAGDPGANPVQSYRHYERLRADIIADPPAGWLLPARAGWQPYPSSLQRSDAERAGGLLDAFALCVERDSDLQSAVEAAGEDPEVAALRTALGNRRDRAARKLRALQAQFVAGTEAPAVRELGHILLARKGSVPSGAAQVRLDDFAGKPITIQLEPRLDAIGNAEAYYDRARRLDRAARELPARIEETRIAITRFEGALAELQAGGASLELRALAGLRAARQGKGSARPPAIERLPYRVYRTTGGLEIRAGRSARDNDALTFRHSSPEDIWMHVRESPGSHVILRWNQRDQNPPLRDITEAAVIAAVLSQARGSGLVPVSWTRRKYVRKPRKAGPGTVSTQRTQTLFVEPDANLMDRLAVDGDMPPAN